MGQGGALSADDGAGGPTSALWPAFVAALLAAFVAWLWHAGKGGGEKEAAATGSQAGCPQPPDEEELRGGYRCLASETKPNDVSVCQEPAQKLLSSLGEHSVPKETPETEPLAKPATPLMNCTQYPGKEIFHFPATTSEPLKNEEMRRADISAEAGAPGNKCEEKCRDQLHHNALDHEDWEIVPGHSGWGDTNRNSNAEDVGGNKDLELAKRVAAVSPVPQTVHVTFRVHYNTYSETQLMAVTGDHECLGQWQHYFPLRYEKDGFWSDTVVLPVDTRIEWKFIVVENGKVRRWEECDNRTLMTEHSDQLVHKCWGFH